MSKQPVIGFAGMTHLGLNSGVAAAEKGFQVLGFDTNAERIAQLQAGKTDVREPDLSELMAKNASRLKFTANLADLKECDIVYISLDVPTNDDATSNLAPIEAMVAEVNKAIRADALLVVLCQVPPGFTRRIERKPECLYYQVETLIFGKAMERALYPERYILGCADPKQPLDARYEHYLKSYNCPLLPMRYESAELAKTAINLFLAASVCTANTLAEVCEQIGADWSEIIPSLRLDKRIGQHAYIEPGLGLSGGNIERDLRTVSNLGYEHGAKVNMTMGMIEHSAYRKQWPSKQFFKIYDAKKADTTVAVLGLAYKADTHSIKNSPSVELLEALPNIKIQAYDPVVKSVPLKGKNITYAASAVDAIKGADIVFVMTPWGEFKTIDWAAARKSMRGDILIDPFTFVKDAADFNHIVLGKAA